MFTYLFVPRGVTAPVRNSNSRYLICFQEFKCNLPLRDFTNRFSLPARAPLQSWLEQARMRSVRSLWWQASPDLQSCESRPGQMCPPCSLIEHWDSAHGDLPIPVEKRRLVNESPKLVHEFHIKCCKLTDWTISLWLTNVFTVQRMLRILMFGTNAGKCKNWATLLVWRECI